MVWYNYFNLKFKIILFMNSLILDFPFQKNYINLPW